MKSCAQIEAEINELKKMNQQRKVARLFEESLKKKICESNSQYAVCDDCNCWKLPKEAKKI